MSNVPVRDVTFVFTDIEGSTRLLHDLGEEAYAATLALHHGLIREASGGAGGVEIDNAGDGVLFVFPPTSTTTSTSTRTTKTATAIR